MVGVDTRECSLHHDLRPISDSGRSVEIKCSTRLDGLSRWPRRVVFPSAGVPEAISRPHLLDGVITISQWSARYAGTGCTWCDLRTQLRILCHRRTRKSKWPGSSCNNYEILSFVRPGFWTDEQQTTDRDGTAQEFLHLSDLLVTVKCGGSG